MITIRLYGRGPLNLDQKAMIFNLHEALKGNKAYVDSDIILNLEEGIIQLAPDNPNAIDIDIHASSTHFPT